MIVRQLVVLLLWAGGLTACDHSSPHTDARAAPPYTAAEVRRAFAQAGISLFRTEPGPGSGVSALFQSDSGVLVAVYPPPGIGLSSPSKTTRSRSPGAAMCS